MPDPLDEVLRQAQDLGFFGPGRIEDQRRHAERLCRLATHGLERGRPLRFLDLGSGGGLPGLVLATLWPGSELEGTLLDSQRRRTSFLARAVDRLDLGGRISVVTARAEGAARDPGHRERYGLVVARGFGPPPVTAECAVAFLSRDGRLVVSEPPAPDPGRWDPAGLAELGLAGPEPVAEADVHAVLLHRAGPLDARWPRKAGIPRKRPLW